MVRLSLEHGLRQPARLLVFAIADGDGRQAHQGAQVSRLQLEGAAIALLGRLQPSHGFQRRSTIDVGVGELGIDGQGPVERLQRLFGPLQAAEALAQGAEDVDVGGGELRCAAKAGHGFVEPPGVLKRHGVEVEQQRMLKSAAQGAFGQDPGAVELTRLHRVADGLQSGLASLVGGDIGRRRKAYLPALEVYPGNIAIEWHEALHLKWIDTQ